MKTTTVIATFAATLLFLTAGSTLAAGGSGSSGTEVHEVRDLAVDFVRHRGEALLPRGPQAPIPCAHAVRSPE